MRRRQSSGTFRADRAAQASGLPVILALNKNDRVPKPRILPAIGTWRHLADFAEIVPVSALKGDNVDRLEKVVLERLPEGEPLYPEDFLTDLPERFFVAEMVRERILHHTREEIPYVTGVVIESFQEEEGLGRIQAAVLVERENQKGILIGKKGTMLKQIGSLARTDLEIFFASRIFLQLFVRVRKDWTQDKRMLKEFGYTEE